MGAHRSIRAGKRNALLAPPPPGKDVTPSPDKERSPKPTPPAAKDRLAMSRPVFQMTALPMPINPDDYRNPITPSNPEGFLPFAQNALVAAQRAYAAEARPNLGGTPGTWCAVYPGMADWVDWPTERYQFVSIDLKAPEAMHGAYVTIPEQADGGMGWSIDGAKRPLAPGTCLQRITMKVLQVTLQRPWLDLELFSLPGIELRGGPPNYFSNGALTANDGVLPLVTLSFFLAVDVKISATWAKEDLELLASAAKRGRLGLGSFALTTRGVGPQLGFDGTTLSAPAHQIVAWTSALVPACPQGATST